MSESTGVTAANDRRGYFFASATTHSVMVRGFVLLIVAITLFATVPAGSGEIRPWRQGKTPPLMLKDIDGKPRSLAQFRGKVIVMNFWATWCEPCITEMPSLAELRKRHAGKPLEVIGVNLAEGEPRIRAFMNKTGIDFPLLRDDDGEAKKAWKVGGIPHTFVIDASGRVRFSIIGETDFADPAVEARILSLLKPAPKRPGAAS
ncbi:MAG TPA: redoxin domain-containing protein [Usitatibacteraceae bacterium]|nr:redoxin domain-containing protein [Usitatibacteraceae bacterium]